MLEQNTVHNQASFDIIMLALPRWDTPYSSTSYSLAKELAKSNRVFYIDNPFTIKDFITIYRTKHIRIRKQALLYGRNNYTQIKGTPSGFTVITPRMTLPINALPPGKLYNFFSKINDRILYSTIKKMIRDFGISKYIYINSFNPLYSNFFPKEFAPSITIYQAVDDISESSYMYKHGTRLEKKVLQAADITLTTSLELTRLKSKHAQNVFYLPNAAAISLFNTVFHTELEAPEEIRHEPRPIICYMGNLDGRVDYKLLKDIATYHHQKLLLLIGPLNTSEYFQYKLDQLPNVKHIGPKEIHLLPAYLRWVHCTIIPFKLTRLTKSIYPLKLNEYLAAGKPVVTINFSKEVESFEAIVYIAKNIQEFIKLIDRAIYEDCADKNQERVKWVASNSWTARAEQFWKIILTYLNNKADAN